jgi:hypothetical protein
LDHFHSFHHFCRHHCCRSHSCHFHFQRWLKLNKCCLLRPRIWLLPWMNLSFLGSCLWQLEDWIQSKQCLLCKLSFGNQSPLSLWILARTLDLNMTVEFPDHKSIESQCQ